MDKGAGGAEQAENNHASGNTIHPESISREGKNRKLFEPGGSLSNCLDGFAELGDGERLGEKLRARGHVDVVFSEAAGKDEREGWFVGREFGGEESAGAVAEKVIDDRNIEVVGGFSPDGECGFGSGGDGHGVPKGAQEPDRGYGYERIVFDH